MEKERYFKSFDGMPLFMKSNRLPESKAVLLIVHGLCEHLGRYEYMTGKLLERNYAVYRFDHRGHGKSEGQPAHYDDFHTLVDDVNAAVELVKVENPDLPLYVIGHSMGGFAVTTFAMKYPGKAKGIVTSGAVTRMNQNLSIPLDLPPNHYIPNELGGGVCSDPAVVEAYENDPLVGKEFTVGLFQSLKRGVQWNREHSSLFVEPALIMHGCNDGLVSEKDSRDFYGDISSEDKTLIIYARLSHEIFNETVKDRVIGDVLDWLDIRIQ